MSLFDDLGEGLSELGEIFTDFADEVKSIGEDTVDDIISIISDES